MAKLPKIVELPSQEPSPTLQDPNLRNGIMNAQINGGLEIIGKMESLDGQSSIDLDEGQIIINDGSNDRVLIGKFD